MIPETNVITKLLLTLVAIKLLQRVTVDLHQCLCYIFSFFHYSIVLY